MAESPTSATPPYEFSIVADADLAPRLARAAFTSRRRHWRVWLGLLAAVFVLTLLTSEGSDAPGEALTMTLLAAVGTLALGAILTYAGNAATLRNLAPRVFDGAVLATAFDDESFVLATPVSSARYPYSAVRNVQVLDGVVIFQVQGSAARHIFPAELFPRPALDRLQAAA
jgi:hypothetical protein